MRVNSAAQSGQVFDVMLQVVAYTPRGRAYNSASGSLGATANAAFLATTYGATEMYSNGALAARYVCWARSQLRYMLGDADQSYVVGYGVRAPAHADNRAASCPPPPQQCNAVTGLLNPNANPNVLYGALVEGALFSDRFQDVRALNSTNVQLDYNAGFQACPVRPMIWDTWEVKAQKHMHCETPFLTVKQPSFNSNVCLARTLTGSMRLAGGPGGPVAGQRLMGGVLAGLWRSLKGPGCLRQLVERGFTVGSMGCNLGDMQRYRVVITGSTVRLRCIGSDCMLDHKAMTIRPYCRDRSSKIMRCAYIGHYGVCRRKNRQSALNGTCSTTHATTQTLKN